MVYLLSPQIFVESLASTLKFYCTFESMSCILEQIWDYIFKFLVCCQQIDFLKDQKVSVLDCHCWKLSFSIIVVIIVAVNEVNFSEIVTLTNFIIDNIIILFIENITCLSTNEKIYFVNRVTFLIYKSLFFNFYRPKERHQKGYKVRRFVF